LKSIHLPPISITQFPITVLPEWRHDELCDVERCAHFRHGQGEKANELYLLFRGKVKDEGAKALLKDLADQELGHWRMIQEAF